METIAIGSMIVNLVILGMIYKVADTGSPQERNPMNTTNLDTLMEQAANADRRTYEGARIRTRVARLFATHGPAMVAVLKAIITSHANGNTSRTALNVDDAMRLLVKLDQYAT